MKLFAGRTLRRFTEPVNESSGNGTATATEVVTNAGEADLVTSEARLSTRRKYHKPVIDIDVTAHLWPSATPGHSHLYLGASRERGYTAVRVPWKPKGIAGRSRPRRSCSRRAPQGVARTSPTAPPRRCSFAVNGEGVAVEVQPW